MRKHIYIKLLFKFIFLCLIRGSLFAQPVTQYEDICVGDISTYTLESVQGATIRWQLLGGGGVIVNDGIDQGTKFSELTVLSGSVYISEIQIRWSNNSGSSQMKIYEKTIDGTESERIRLQITRHALPVINSISVSDITCNGNNDGSITVNATGDGPVLEYSFNGGAYSYSNIYNNLLAGAYTVDVRYEILTHCSVSDNNIVVSEPAQLNADVSFINLTCGSVSDGSITISNPTGGWGNYEYSINGGGNWSSSGNFTNLDVGSYDVAIRDSDYPSCTKNLGTINLSNDSEPPTVNCPADIDVCADSEISQDAIVNNIGLSTADYDDNCSIDANLTVMYRIEKDAAVLVDFGDDPDGDPGGYNFTEGTSVVTYKIIDESSNEQTCSFNISVKHKPNPLDINY